jgi:hypothetical protein
VGFSKAAELVEQIILALAYPLFPIVHRSQLFLRNHIHLQPSSVFDSHVIGKKARPPQFRRQLQQIHRHTYLLW